MTDPRRSFAESYRAMQAWLFDAALPLWATRGVDPAGGFHEKIGQDGRPVDEPRRTRVIARQIYCFAAADRMGWSGDGAALVAHGMAALAHAAPGRDGLVIATTAADGTPLDTRYDFYDHAFALFGLAQAGSMAPHRAAALDRAHALQDAMEARLRHPSGGFLEDAEGAAPLRANPHMHMLEACLALAGVDDSPRWRWLADEIVDLAFAHFIDPATGALRELFDADWRALTDAEGQAIEPGHQFEWAWLLAAWNDGRDSASVARAAARLAGIGADHGVTASGCVIDALDSGLRAHLTTARLWPQCERMKCHVEQALRARDAPAADHWWRQAQQALASWAPFLGTAIAGLWFDRLDEAGAPVIAPAPASTLYHTVCALETAQRALAGEGAAATLGLSRATLSG